MYEREPVNDGPSGTIGWNPPNESAARQAINEHAELPNLPDQASPPLDLAAVIGPDPVEQKRVADELAARYQELTA